MTEIKKEEEVNQIESRKFLGVFPPISSFDKKHLKAYLRGNFLFGHGRNKDGSPTMHEVEQEYYMKDEGSK